MFYLPEGGTTTIYEQTYRDYTLSLQFRPPFCAPAPPECTLAITGNTTTDVSIRGEDDGSITVNFSGSTGTTSCRINGVLDGTTAAASYTFTGLSAGYYDIVITEGDCFDSIGDIQILDGEFRTGDLVVNQPADLVAAENPIILNLKTARSEGTPRSSNGTISVGGTVNDGDSLTFVFTYPQDYTATFYAKAFPNRDTYFLASVLKDANGVSVGTNTNIEIATSIAEVLEADSVISRLYFIRVSGIYIYLTAKENNTKLDINTVLTESSTNIDVTSTQQGSSTYDGQLSQDYSLYTNILINNNTQYGEIQNVSSFEKVAQLELPFNKSNQHLFDLSEVLKNFVSTPKIDFTLTGYTTISNMICAYQCEYGEKYPLVQNSTTKKSRIKGTTTTKFVLNSALPWEVDNDMTDILGDTIHNLNPYFSGTFEFAYPTAGETQVTITDYLLDATDTGKTTDIQFKVVDSYNGATYDWQTSNVIDLTDGLTYPNGGTGTVYISGTSSGIAVEYSRQIFWWNAFDSGNISGYGGDASLRNGVKFLTNSPNPKFVQRDSSEFLYLMLPKDYGKTLKIKGNLYFYDGTELTGETLYTVSTGSTNYGGVFMFAAGYNELGLADYETYSGGTRKIRRVDFALYQYDATNGDMLMSEEKSYRYEIDEQPRRYGVAFLNKLGTYDIFDFAGEIVNSVTHENETYEVPRALNLGGASPYGFQSTTVYNTKVVKTIAANTGWIDEEHFDWLQELIESNRCYNYTETDESFLIIKSVDYKKSSNDDLYQIDVDFEETLYQNQISV